MEQLDRVIRILKNPSIELTKVKYEQIGTSYLLRYMALLSLVPALGYFIGMGVVGLNINKPSSLIIPMEWAAIGGILQYILSFSGFYVTAVAINILASNFESKKNEIQAMKLAAYTSTPGLLGGIPLIIPEMSDIGLLFGLYGIYLLYSGIPILMETPKNKVMAYTIGIIIVMSLSFVVIEKIVSIVMSWSPVPA